MFKNSAGAARFLNEERLTIAVTYSRHRPVFKNFDKFPSIGAENMGLMVRWLKG
jgi:hypothetical protein